MAITHGQVGVILVLVGIVVLLAPNFLAVVGGFGQNNMRYFDVNGPLMFSITGAADEPIQTLNVTVGLSAVTNSLYGQGGLATSLMQVYGGQQFIGSVPLTNLGDRMLVTGNDPTTTDGKTNANSWGNRVASYLFDMKGEQNVNLTFVFQNSRDPVGGVLFLKSVEYVPVGGTPNSTEVLPTEDNQSTVPSDETQSNTTETGNKTASQDPVANIGKTIDDIVSGNVSKSSPERVGTFLLGAVLIMFGAVLVIKRD